MTCLSPFGLTATEAARQHIFLSTGSDGLHTEQLRVHRKTLNINMFSQRAAGQIWPMVKCWTTIREARDGLQTYWPPRRFRIRERYALVPNTVARTFDAGGSRARETG